MSLDSIRIAFYGTLKSTLETLSIPFRFESIREGDPIVSQDQLWVRAFLQPDESFQHSIGTSTPLTRSTGLFVIEIYDREEKGFAEIFRTIDSVKPYFYRKTFDSGKISISKINISKRSIVNGWISSVMTISYIDNR